MSLSRLWQHQGKRAAAYALLAPNALDEPLASRLQAQAAARRVSPEEFARALLDEALQHMDDAEARAVQNQRRVTLIRKSAVEALTEAEQAELQGLQETADRRLAGALPRHRCRRV